MSRSLLNSNARSAKVITYKPELRRYTGSVTATILFQQLLFWFEYNDYKPFYKFLEPNDHQAYKEGDSWVEEIAFSKEEFSTAFKKIGEKYKSKTEMRNSPNKFNGKPFVAYFDRQTGLTYYDIDLDKAQEILENAYSTNSTQQTTPPDLRETGNPDFQKQGIPISRNRESRFPIYNSTENTTENTTESGADQKNENSSKTKEEEKMQKLESRVEEIKNNPLFSMRRSSDFPDLTDENIDVEIKTFLWDKKGHVNFQAIINYLIRCNSNRLKAKKHQQWYRKNSNTDNSVKTKEQIDKEYEEYYGF